MIQVVKMHNEIIETILLEYLSFYWANASTRKLTLYFTGS